jgi:hypothetical protein
MLSIAVTANLHTLVEVYEPTLQTASVVYNNPSTRIVDVLEVVVTLLGVSQGVATGELSFLVKLFEDDVCHFPIS